MTNRFIFILLAVIIVAVGATALLISKEHNSLPQVCTAEAKMCPDGSYVGRTGPRCQFAECPSSSGTTVIKTDTGVLTGQVTLSPTCPVERIPPDPACAPKPYSTLFDVISNSNTKFSLQVHTDTNGRFFMHLPVGTYTIEPHIEALYPRCQSATVTIAVNATTTENISCDTGIR